MMPDVAGPLPQILSIGTANPPRRYTQQEILDRLPIKNPKIEAIFRGSHIDTRHLYLPDMDASTYREESNAELIDRHRRGALEIGPQAVTRCLERLGIGVQDVDLLVCISSTGFMCPGITAHLIKAMGFRPDVHRVDILGMGCNAGMNGMNTVASFCRANPGKRALMVCVEVCSAAYVLNDDIVTGVVNALFGDGCAAVLLQAPVEGAPLNGPQILGFVSQIITAGIHTMRFDLDGSKLSFFLDKDIPYVIGANIHIPVGKILDRFGLKRRDIRHWIIHSGGKKVIDSIKYNLDLTAHDLRHTEDILRRFGNLSSGAFLFSYERLMQEGTAQPGDLGVAIAMGPGASIETALLRW